MKQEKLKRVNMNLPAEMVDEIDSERKKLNLNRTSYITMALSMYLNQQNAMQTLQALAIKMPTVEQGDNKNPFGKNKMLIIDDDYPAKK